MELPALPDDALAIADALRRGLGEILGERFASLFLYGAIAFPRPARWKIDFDFHVLVHGPLADSDRAAITVLHERMAGRSELGADLDGYYVLLADAARPDPPRHQLDLRIRDEAWALHRAHIHARRSFLIAGLDPIEVVPEPTWIELEQGLRAELRFVNEHPEASAFGMLNGCRILCSFEHRDVVMSKYHAAEWALASLPDTWHDAIRAATRFYTGDATADDARTLERERPRFGSFVNRLVPAT